MPKSPLKTDNTRKAAQVKKPIGSEHFTRKELNHFRRESKKLAVRDKRVCWVDAKRARPCGECPAIDFGGTEFEFWAVDFKSRIDGTLGTVTFRMAPGTGNPTPEVRMERLKYELVNELEFERDRIDGKGIKYGPGWQFMKRAELGRTADMFAKMLRAVENGKPRRACACEVAAWLGSHDDDRQNMEISLNALFRPFLNARRKAG